MRGIDRSMKRDGALRAPHAANRRRRHGAVTVEFALTAPILLLIFVGSIEFGRAHMVRHTVQNAVYEGARAGLVPRTTDEEIREATRRVLLASGIRSGAVTVLQTEDQVTVRCEVPFKEESWVSPFFFSDMLLSSVITLTRDAG